MQFRLAAATSIPPVASRSAKWDELQSPRPAIYIVNAKVLHELKILLEQRQQEDQAKLKWLRRATREGFEQIRRGDGIEFRSLEELEEHIDRLGREVSAELSPGRKRA